MKLYFKNRVMSVPLIAATMLLANNLQAADSTNAVPGAIRINAGAGAVKDSAGTAWLAETGIEGGDVIERPGLPIDGTKQPELYQSEHYGMNTFSYKLPNGRYRVKLHFCETYEGIMGPGERVFSFDVEGQAFKDFDVWAKAGGFAKAYVETVDVEVADGKLDIQFTPLVENPQINGIEILPPSADSGTNNRLGTVRINAGGSAVKDGSGQSWLAESGIEGGEVIERPDLPIDGTKQPEIYRSEHYGMDSFRYKLPNGKYQVKLHFCETYEGIMGPGERVFSLDVEGRAFKDFDVWARSGGFAKAYVETVEVEVTDERLDITFTPIVENPQINAIEIVPGA